MKIKRFFYMIVALFVFMGINSSYATTKGVNALFDSMKASKYDPHAMVRFIPYNVKAWFARWKILKNAKKSIYMTYFIVDKDIFGTSLLGLLMEKAKQGLQIRIMMDARGTKGFIHKLRGGDLLQELAKFPNVQIKVYNPIHKRLLSAFRDIRTLTASDHDKIILVDGEYLVTGGRNISKNYFVDPRDIPTVYRDSDVVIKSTVVGREAKQAFEEEFKSDGTEKVTKDLFGDIDDMHHYLSLAYYAMDRYINGKGLTPINKKMMPARYVKVLEGYNKELSAYKHLIGYNHFKLFEGQHCAAVRVLDKHSFNGTRNDITPNLIAMIDAAKKEIMIQNPYVVLTPKARAALKRASDRGVKIIIHTNSPVSTDSLLTQAFFLGDWKQALKDMPNLRIFAYKIKRKLHSKVFVFDRKVAVVGTYNMDYVSEQINSEVVAMIKSPSFATRVALRIYADMKNAVEYKIKVERDGSIKTIYGPASHSSPEVIRRLNWLMKLHWLRPLI